MLFNLVSSFFLLLCLLSAGCSKYYLTVDQQWVDGNYLASTHARTPDPRQSNPPLGQMLVFDWWVPNKIFKQKPYILVDLIFWDYTTKQVRIPIEKRLSYATYKLLNEEYAKTGGILTYKAEIVTEEGAIYREWKHQLWVKLITIDDEKREEASETNSSVIPQSKQGSVIETPYLKDSESN